MTDTLTVERLDDQGWATLRELRLAALAESPNAFWARQQDEERNSEADWTRFLQAVDWFVAQRDGRPVALIGGLRRHEIPHELELISMWVAPQERRRGIATRLLRAVSAWARENGASALSLWVTDGNEPARRLYEREGFRATGERDGLPPATGRASGEERMRRSILPAR